LDFFGQQVDRTTLRVPDDMTVFLESGFRIAMTQLSLHNDEWCPLFQ
jgi:hypothetical protein